MSEWVRDLISESWFQISVEAILAGALAIWERVANGRPWPEALFLGLVEFGVLFFLAGKLCTPSMRRRVHGWLDAIGYSVQMKEKKIAAFWFVATADGTALDIRRRSAPAAHSVTITSTADVPDVLRQSLVSMNPDARRRALRPIARELLRSGVDVDLASQLSATSGAVVVSDTLAVSDDLTEAEFARTLDEVTRGSKLLTSLLSDVPVPTV